MTVIVPAIALVLASCGGLAFFNDGDSNPMTPEESKAQVVDAARDIARTLQIPGMTANFRHTSCNDQGEAPFRGTVEMFYPLAEDLQQADAERADMMRRLQADGWTTDPDFKSHGNALTKNGVTAIFYSQNVSTPVRNISVLGECRDVTTTENGESEDITLEQ
ncbi:hypothetical protein [Mycolicibacterium sp. XJ870]